MSDRLNAVNCQRPCWTIFWGLPSIRGMCVGIEKCKMLKMCLNPTSLFPSIVCRYMSVDQPRHDDDLEPKNAAGKRGAQDFKPFYVDDTYAEELSDKPAWEVMHLSELEKAENKKRLEEMSEKTNATRVQRSNSRKRNDDSQTQQYNKRPWECEAKIKWLDLGYDYYPRYLRTVECTRHACFYGHFTCTPRSFTVKILRRRRGECVQTKNNVGIDGLHGDLKELWIWEERAVNFCCDCSASWSHRHEILLFLRPKLYFLRSSFICFTAMRPPM